MNIFDRIILKLFRKKIVRNYDKFCNKKIGNALLYYKTDSLLLKKLADQYIHTNFWEVLEITKILNELGYVVDVLGREINISDVNKLEDKYDVFIGIGAGDSGMYFADIAEKLNKAKKIFYAAGPEPEESNKITIARHDFFKERHPNSNIVVRRTITKVDIERCMKNTDFIFAIGNEFSMGTYSRFNKPIYRINPSTSPKIRASLDDLRNKDKKKFLYFGGNGNITKGLDLLIESFEKNNDAHLFVCAPHESDFDNVYKDVIPKMKNIHWIGFIPVGGEKFNNLTSECGFVILPSSSEGIATSVVNCLRKGLIPVVTREAGIDTEDFGFLIRDISIDSMSNYIKDVSSIGDKDFMERIYKSYLNSFNYTQSKFSEMFKNSLIDILLNKTK